MEIQRRGSDGRQPFSAEFKREQIARVLGKELTFAELSRERAIDQPVVRRAAHATGNEREAYLRRRPADFHESLADEGWE